MKRTYVYDEDAGAMVEKIPHRRRDSHYVIEDIKPYKSMIDGSIIKSRSHHRQHLRDNGCIEVGNERMETKVQPVKDTRKEVLKAQIANMTHNQANKLLSELRNIARFTNPHRR